jgi:hypothetical protein
VSFFDRIKKGVGIGDTTISIVAPDQIADDSGRIECDVALTAGATQAVTSIGASFSRVLAWERAEETYLESTQTYIKSWSPQSDVTVLGHTSAPAPFTLGKNEVKNIHFVVPVRLITPADHAAISVTAGEERNHRVYFQVSTTAALEDAKDKQAVKIVTVVRVESPAPAAPAVPGGPAFDAPPPPNYLPPEHH